MRVKRFLDGGSIGPINLSAGVTAKEVFIFLFVATIANSLSGFVSLMQSFVLTEQLDLAPNELGRLGGYMSTVQQIAVISVVGITGGLADRIGRRWMLIATLVGFSLCALSFPIISTVAALVVVRAAFGLASACHTSSVPTKLFDLPANDSRGKFIAMTMIVFGMTSALLVGGVGARLPAWFNGLGFSTLTSGRFAFYIAAAVGLIAAGAAYLFMAPDTPKAARGPRLTPLQELKRFASGFTEVARHARANPNFGLLFATSFVIRTDDAILRSFLSLWIVAAAHEQGISTVAALKVVGVLLSIQYVIALIVPPIMGWVLDRVSRVKVYVAALGFVGVALMSTVFITDVTSWPIFVLGAVIGVAESTQTISSTALFGQEAPERLRGTAYGVFAVLGTVTVIAVTLIGGFMFDVIGYHAPFVLAGGLHGVFFVAALVLTIVNARRLAAARLAS